MSQFKAIRFCGVSAVTLAAAFLAAPALAAPCTATTTGIATPGPAPFVTVNCAAADQTGFFDTTVSTTISTPIQVYDGNGNDVLNLNGQFATAFPGPVVDGDNNLAMGPQTDSILTFGGNDTVTINGATVQGSIFAGDGNDTVTLNSGSIGLASGQLDSIGLEIGDDTFNMTGGSTVGGVSGGDGNDTFNISGGTIGDYVAGGIGNDVFNISGTARITNQLTAEDGDDRIIITGGTIGTYVDAGPGNDAVLMSGGSVGQYIFGGTGNDRITVTGGTVGTLGGEGPQGLFGDAGNDSIVVSGGTINGDIDGGDGTDRVVLNSGTVTGGITAESVDLFGGTLLGDVSGLTGNTLIINAPGGITLADGIVFSGTNAVATITNTDLAKAGNGSFLTQRFAGFTTVTANNSTLGIGGGTQRVGLLSLLNGSTLYVRGLNAISSPAGPQGNLTVSNSAVNFINGVASDVLNAGDVVLNNARLAFDVNPTTGGSDQLVATRSLAASGANVVLVNVVGGNPQAITIIPISPISGEIAPTGGAASALFSAIGVPGTPGAIYAFDIINGPNGGLYLRSNGINFGIPLAIIPAINSAPVNIVLDKVYDITNETILTHYALVTGSRSEVQPSFGIYASGLLAETNHNGYDASGPGFSGVTPGFTAHDFAVAGSVEFDAAKYYGFDKDYGLDIGGYAGYTSSDVTTDPAFGFADFGRGKNGSGMVGSYGLLRQGTTYGLVSVTGFFGNTDISNDILGSTGSYGTAGVAVTATAGHIFSLSDTARFDLRGGVLGVSFRGDDFSDSVGNQFGASKISFGAFKFEPGIYSQYVLSDGTILSPYLRSEFQQRVGYRNTASFNGTEIDFDDADFSIAGSLGVNYKVNATTTLSTEVRMKMSDDSDTFGAKAGIKARF